MNEVPKTPRLRLRVTATAETILRGGHPWLFAESIREYNRSGVTGELAVIFDRKDCFLGVGLYDADSPLRVRMLHVGKPVTIDEAWWKRRLAAAVEIRKPLFEVQTTGYRIINGESDGWPGLVLDRYGDTLVAKLYSAIWLRCWPDLLRWLTEAWPQYRLVLRLSRNIQAMAAKCGLADGTVVHGPALTEPVIFSENGLRFEADVLKGQKTGFFLDQRENRQRVESLAAGRAVLNAFSFSGGFSLYAARGGASSVTDLDLSAHAIASGDRNFKLNQSFPTVAACRRQGIAAEAFEWLGGAGGQGGFDLVILDPPSLAKKEAEREGAIQAYARLAGLGLDRLNADGILVACSCSAHVSPEEFFGAVRNAVNRSGRKFEELHTAGQPADHPARFPEAIYLKAIFLRIANRPTVRQNRQT